ncbi:granulin domain-containing protein [Ditylenchus destructor]|uniref:Granulin domain-containing protein n=1 Tax=Ditylenchus destructor TaxID=166010 RepID=A0AAD4MZC0_9BILA|nr:granulin domain-containing protein [Ditylenchus destructor]
MFINLSNTKRIDTGNQYFPLHKKHSAKAHSKPVFQNNDEIIVHAEELSLGEESIVGEQRKQLSFGSTGRSRLAKEWALSTQWDKLARLGLAHTQQRRLNGEQLMRQMWSGGNDPEVICPDKKSKCPAHTTCCALEDADVSEFVAAGPGDQYTGPVYGCCPAEHAVCCEDHLHCCPENTRCDVEEGRCIQDQSGFSRPWQRKFASTKIVLKPAVEFSGPSERNCEISKLDMGDLWRINVEERAKSSVFYSVLQCPSSNKCCFKSASNHQPNATCCPFSDGVCCSNGFGCCARGYSCNVDGTCESEDSSFTPVKPYEPTTPAEQQLYTLKGMQKETICADGTRCDPMSTCCLVDREDGSSSYSCCPLSQANCCANSCCPSGYHCASAQQCEKSALAELISGFITSKTSFYNDREN